MKGFRVLNFLALVLALLVPRNLKAEDALWLSGIMDSAVVLGLAEGDRSRAGLESELRLVLEQPSRGNLGFRAEGGIRWTYGLLSSLALVYDSGIGDIPGTDELPPNSDLHREPYLDQAYARAVLGRLELKAGLFPLAWGAAYFHNPTARTAAPLLPGQNLDNRTGKLGLSLALALPFDLALEAYALAEARLTEPVPSLDELSLAGLPWGSRLQLRTGSLDISASIMSVLPRQGAASEYWLGMDTTLTLGELSVYAELASRLDITEASLGFWWPVPGWAIDLRGEYIWLQGGQKSSRDYDITAMLAGTSALLGQSYAFLGVEKEDAQASAWHLSLGTLLNLHDWSAGVVVEAAWLPVQELQLSFIARMFTGSGRDEFGGALSPVPGVSIKPYRSLAGLKATWNF